MARRRRTVKIALILEAERFSNDNGDACLTERIPVGFPLAFLSVALFRLLFCCPLKLSSRNFFHRERDAI